MSEARLQRQDGAWRVEGDLTFASVCALLDQEAALLERGGRAVIDLTGVGRADSAGVALLLEWMRRARVAGCSLEYRGIPEQMLAIARISNLEPILPLAG